MRHKLGSHEQLKHKDKINTEIKSPLRLAKIKEDFLFVSSLVLCLAYAWTVILRLLLSLCRRFDFIRLFCLLFCPYAYAYV